MVKSILQYLDVIHSPNLQHLFIFTKSTWWFVSLTYISHLSDHGKGEMVKSILKYMSRNYMYITVPMGARDAKLTPSAHLDKIY